MKIFFTMYTQQTFNYSCFFPTPYTNINNTDLKTMFFLRSPFFCFIYSPIEITSKKLWFKISARLLIANEIFSLTIPFSSILFFFFHYCCSSAKIIISRILFYNFFSLKFLNKFFSSSNCSLL